MLSADVRVAAAAAAAAAAQAENTLQIIHYHVIFYTEYGTAVILDVRVQWNG